MGPPATRLARFAVADQPPHVGLHGRLSPLDSCDYSDRDPVSLAQRCVSTAGEVLLFDEGQEWTLDALPRIVAAIHGAGLECVTMFDLFARRESSSSQRPDETSSKAFATEQCR